jgi:hypothetical protein
MKFSTVVLCDGVQLVSLASAYTKPGDRVAHLRSNGN